MCSIYNKRDIGRSEALSARVLVGERLEQPRIRGISEADAQGDAHPVADVIPKYLVANGLALVVGVECVVDEIEEHTRLFADDGGVDRDGVVLQWLSSEHEARVDLGFVQKLYCCQKWHRGHINHI